MKYSRTRHQIAQSHTYIQGYMNNSRSEMITFIPCLTFYSNSTSLVHTIHIGNLKFHFLQTLWIYLNIICSYTSNIRRTSMWALSDNLWAMSNNMRYKFLKEKIKIKFEILVSRSPTTLSDGVTCCWTITWTSFL